LAHVRVRSLTASVFSAAPLLLSLLAASSPGCRTGAPAAGPQRLGSLQIRCQPADVLVYVDDHLEMAPSRPSQEALALPVGFHRVEIRKDGYFPHFAEITIVEGGRQTIAVALRKEPY
jgi:hypothetical protein